MKKLFALWAALVCSAVFAGGINNPTAGLVPGNAITQVVPIESEGFNYLTGSEDFSGFTVTGSVTVTTNTTLSPDGMLTADTLNTTAGGTGSYVASPNMGSFFPAQNKTVTCSVYIAAGTSTQSRINFLETAGASASVDFNPQNGNIITQSGLTLLNTFTANGTRWLRVGVTMTTTTALPLLHCNVMPASFSASSTGTVIAWGAQIEVAASPSSYVTTDNAQPRYRAPGKINRGSVDFSQKTNLFNTTTYQLTQNDIGSYISMAGVSTITLPAIVDTSSPKLDGYWIELDACGSAGGTTIQRGDTNTSIYGAGLAWSGVNSFVIGTGGTIDNACAVKIIAEPLLGSWIVTPIGQSHGSISYTAGGTFTPTGNVYKVYVTGCAAGGGGGGSTGAGGTGGTASLGALLSLTGGAGGGTGATGATAGGGTQGFPGISGGTAVTNPTQGGGSPWGQGALGRSGLATATVATGKCAGGRAGGTAGLPGGGGDWVVRTPITVVPGTGYTVTIGAVGTAGTDASAAPTAGSGGMLIVDW